MSRFVNKNKIRSDYFGTDFFLTKTFLHLIFETIL